MRYEGAVYRPPSEGRSLIIQATIGCSHNKCTFCDMYKAKKFRMRSLEDIFEDLKWARSRYNYIEKIFLADGDALIMPTNKLVTILEEIKMLFPECKRVSIYASPKSILLKKEEDLSLLKEKGLHMVYLGIESGDEEVLTRVNKGATPTELISAGQRVKGCGIKLSCTLISGLAGKENWKNHAKNSARVINEIDPDYLGLLTLMISNEAPISREVQEGRLTLMSPKEIMEETFELVKALDLTSCVFRSNHASNYAPLGAVLGLEKQRLLKEIQEFIAGDEVFREEHFRGF